MRTSIHAGAGIAYDVLFDNLGLLSLPPQLSTTIDCAPVGAFPCATPFLGSGGILPGPGGVATFPSIADQRAATSALVPVNQKDPKSIDESTDTYDAIEWLLKNIPNNGKVGMMGISYDGWTTMMGTLDPHPALKAASEQATPSDMFLGDDFHHNGAFRLSYGFEYAYMEEATKEDAMFPFDTYDTYEWYLKLGPLSNANQTYFHSKLPSWNDFTKHPNYDEFWQKQAFAPYLNRVTVPTLNVAGWFDQERTVAVIIRRQPGANGLKVDIWPSPRKTVSGASCSPMGRSAVSRTTCNLVARSVIARASASTS